MGRRDYVNQPAVRWMPIWLMRLSAIILMVGACPVYIVVGVTMGLVVAVEDMIAELRGAWRAIDNIAELDAARADEGEAGR